MQFTPQDSVTEKRISLIEEVPTDEILTKVTGREEVSLHPHTHNRHQIIYILSGTLHVEVEESSYFVTGRHLIWIPRGVEHRLSSNNSQISLLTSYFAWSMQGKIVLPFIKRMNWWLAICSLSAGMSLLIGIVRLKFLLLQWDFWCVTSHL